MKAVQILRRRHERAAVPNSDLEVRPNLQARELRQVFAELIRILPDTQPLPAMSMQLTGQLIQRLVVEAKSEEQRLEPLRIRERIGISFANQCGPPQVDRRRVEPVQGRPRHFLSAPSGRVLAHGWTEVYLW